MKAQDKLLIFPNEDPCGPYGVKKHDQDGCFSGDTVKGQSPERSGNHEHGGGSDRIAYQPTPEKPEVPPLQPALDPFSPDTDRVQYHGQVDENDRVDEFGGHAAQM